MDGHYSNIEHAVIRDLRKGSSPLLRRVKANNRIILHNYQRSIKKTFHCLLPFCGKKFQVSIIPNQVIYPKYCPEHRTYHRRKHFIGLRFSTPGKKG